MSLPAQSPLYRLAGSLVSGVVGISLVVVWASTIGGHVWGLPGAFELQLAAFLLFVLLSLPAVPRSAWFLMAMCGATALAAFLLREDWLVLMGLGLSRAAFLATLFAALSMLREAARHSAAVHQCGEMLVSRPPGQRYAALSGGGSLFCVILNFGAMNLLGAMVKATNTLEKAGGDERVRSIREKRMILALLRSFSASIMLSPLSVGFALILSAFPQLGWQLLLPMGFAFALVFLALGWLFDRLTMPAPPPGSVASSAHGWSAALPLLGIVAGIIAAAILVEILLETSLVLGVMVAVPLFGCGWIFVQTPALGLIERAARTGRRVRHFLLADLSRSQVEVLIVSSAGFMGVVLAALLPLAELRELVSESAASPYLILAGLFVTVLLLGQAGFNPIVSVTVLSALFPIPEALGLHPLALAMALLTSWALAAGSSYAIAAVLILARLTGKNASTIGRDWNGPFTVMAGILLLGLVLGLQMILGVPTG
ncbi:hypothetical protein [Telmatospirillum sp. J64-1]|uniref:hypothetical protein n=1 Tax=Telmatospirillum sp. J64-1 TaxID=2502183 RepID=UPI00115D9B70|nr:hypothetical protein [Telmatospirillum sp. J64-1]